MNSVYNGDCVCSSFLFEPAEGARDDFLNPEPDEVKAEKKI